MNDPSFTAESHRNEPVRYPPLQVIDLAAEGAETDGVYSNIVVNRVNQHCLRLAVFEGDYPWHHHPTSDELFLVVEGCLLIDLADGRTMYINRGLGYLMRVRFNARPEITVFTLSRAEDAVA